MSVPSIKIAIVGYGNVGRGAVDAVQTSSDMTLVGVVEPDRSQVQAGMPEGTPVVDDIRQLGTIDAAIMCLRSRMVYEHARSVLEMGVSTIDCFDVHGAELLAMKRGFHEICLRTGARAITGAGWDPGTDSVIRSIMLAMTPRGLTSTTFGPGISMGHTAAVKSLPGVRDALSLTIPVGSGVHRRQVYVELEDRAQEEEIRTVIRNDPYFMNDETTVDIVEDVTPLVDHGHGARIERVGVAGKTHNQHMRYVVRCTNPALTGQVMVAAARAAMKMAPGAYTLIEIPPVFMLDMDTDEAVSRLV